MTRKSKQVLSKEVLLHWLKECKEIGFDIANAPKLEKPKFSVFDRLKQEFQNLCQTFGLKDKTTDTSVAAQAAQYAVAHLSERSAVFAGKGFADNCTASIAW